MLKCFSQHSILGPNSLAAAVTVFEHSDGICSNVVLHPRLDLYSVEPIHPTAAISRPCKDVLKEREIEADPILAALVVKNKMFLTWSFLP